MLRTKTDVESGLPILLRTLDDPDAMVRIHAAELLLQLDPKAVSAQRALLEELRSREVGIQQMAGADLERIGASLASELIPQLKRLLKERDGLLRLQVARILARLGPAEARLAQETVLSGLRDKNVLVRRDAVQSLKAAVKDLDTVLPTLREALRDEEDRKSTRLNSSHRL